MLCPKIPFDCKKDPPSCQTGLHKIWYEQFVVLDTLEGVTTHCTDIQHTTATNTSFIQCVLCDNVNIPVKGKQHSFSQCMNGE